MVSKGLVEILKDLPEKEPLPSVEKLGRNAEGIQDQTLLRDRFSRCHQPRQLLRKTPECQLPKRETRKEHCGNQIIYSTGVFECVNVNIYEY